LEITDLGSKQLQHVLNAATLVSVISTDKDGLITVFNPGAEGMLGYSVVEMVDKHSPALIHHEPEVIKRGKELSLEYGRLVISDIEMPEMDGYELTRRIRYGTVPQYKDIPILILTGQDTDTNVKKARIHKIDGFIVKPPKKDQLEILLKKSLGF